MYANGSIQHTGLGGFARLEIESGAWSAMLDSTRNVERILFFGALTDMSRMGTSVKPSFV